MNIEELYFNWTYTYISISDIEENTPQVIIIPEVKYYHYCFARQMLLLMSDIIVELLKSYIVLKFPKSKIVTKSLKSDNVVDTWFDTKLSLSKRHRVLHRAVFFTLFFALY